MGGWRLTNTEIILKRGGGGGGVVDSVNDTRTSSFRPVQMSPDNKLLTARSPEITTLVFVRRSNFNLPKMMFVPYLQPQEG